MKTTAVHVRRLEQADRSSDTLPLVLLHGWGLNCGVFDSLAAGLVARRDVWAADLPGHGASGMASWNEYCAALLDLLPPRFDLLGWSLGGQLALELARLAPARVGRLVLVATTPKFVACSSWVHGMRPDVLRSFATELAGDYRRTVNEFLRLQVRGSLDAEATLQSLQGALLAHGEARPEALRAGLEWLETRDFRERCQAISLPALAIAGQYDRVTPPSAVHELAAFLPQGESLELRRAGHAPFLSHQAECLEAIDRWLTPVTT
jgi:pimeloyl-[acyl-carrier protein] methyl ester esterase